MGNSQSTIAKWKEQQQKLEEPDKVHYYNVPEHVYDDYPYHVPKEGEDVGITKLNVSELFSGDSDLKAVGEKMLDGFAKHSVIVLTNTDATFSKLKELQEQSKLYLACDKAQKEKFPAESVDGKRAFFSGYSEIHFPNRDNKRDPEWRDVFQVRLGEEGHIPWPSTPFEKAATEHYMQQWEISLQILKALAVALGWSVEETFFKLLGGGVGAGGEQKVHKSQNTNLCLFRYSDKQGTYKTTQKCMIHEDTGLLTILPKTDFPGIELFHPHIQKWILLEPLINDNDMLLYCGLSMQKLTNGLIPATTHRVVRQPGRVRYSMPFEVKPDDDAILRNVFVPTEREQTYDGLSKALAWKKVQIQVRRSDGIVPGSDEERRILDAELAEEQRREANLTLKQPCIVEEFNKQQASNIINDTDKQKMLGTDMDA